MGGIRKERSSLWGMLQALLVEREFWWGWGHCETSHVVKARLGPGICDICDNQCELGWVRPLLFAVRKVGPVLGRLRAQESKINTQKMWDPELETGRGLLLRTRLWV